jgi:hypothetical protein
MSNNGIQLLNRGLQIARRGDGTYWGSPVEAYKSNVIVSTQIIPNTTEIRFLCSTGVTLLYDYQYDQWGTFTDHLGVDSIIFNGGYVYLQSAGNTMAEAAGLYTDNGTGFSLVATSAWLKPSALQGFGRLWRFLLQGFFPSSVSSIQVQIAYNYNPAIVDTFVYTPTQASNADQTQLRVDNSIQKCESLQFTIQVLNPTSSTKALALNALDFEYGVKKGGKKLGPSQALG